MHDIYDDARLYDLSVPTGGVHAEHYVAQARRVGGPLLELACGTGRLLVPFVEAGLDVVGLDASEAMLGAARERLPTVELHLGDMREFHLGRRFGLVMVGFNALLHLHERSEFEGLLRCVREHLEPDGRFAFDVFSPAPRILARDPTQRFKVLEKLDPDVGEVLTIMETTDYDLPTQTNRTRWTYSYPSRPEFRVRDLNLRCIFPAELEMLLHYNGFEIEQRWGGYAQEPFTSASMVQAVVARAL